MHEHKWRKLSFLWNTQRVDAGAISGCMNIMDGKDKIDLHVVDVHTVSCMMYM